MELIPVIFYGVLLSFILCYSIIELLLMLRFIFSIRQVKKANAKFSLTENENDYPMVSIQLPVFNEYYVVERLLENLSQLDYPKNKFEIQLIDDSTDESFAVAEKKVSELLTKGISISHIRRETREGFKAGALAYAFKLAKGEFILILDADFLPDKNFLKTALPFFQDTKIGVVQARWTHLNKNYSLVTRLQAFALDAHFTIEQIGRNEGNHFINFNGTAGIWRKSCIEDSGGWSSDTLTEDLDLSYRAQLKGWKFKYLEELHAPAELPADMNALKQQQFRWSKGAAECARKHLKNVFKSSKISFSTKLFAFFHLMNSFLFICIFLLGLLSIPIIYIVKQYPEHENLYSLFVIYYSALFFITLFYLVSEYYNAQNKIQSVFYFLGLFPVFLSVSMGLSFYNAFGVLEGYLGIKSPFIRTPKYNIKGQTGTWQKARYSFSKLPVVSFMELIFSLIFLGAIFYAISLGSYLVLPYFVLLCLGFGFVFISSIQHLSK